MIMEAVDFDSNWIRD